MDKTVEKLTEIGSFPLAGNVVKVMLRQQVKQEVFFTCEETIASITESRALPPFGLKEVRRVRRLLGQAENKMRKLIEKIAREKKKHER